MSELYDTLHRVFGFRSFRPNQEAIISAILSGRDVFAVMPTGGGKSLCYQFPAQCLDGLCVVISPLISLMKDQVDAAQANGLRAEVFNSSLSAADRVRVFRQLEQGEIDLLYVSPERFAMPDFMETLKASSVAFFAIDEAHCISEWGHDFRPDYLLLSQIIPEFPHAIVAAFTATATHQVAEDIVAKLGLRNPHLTRASFDRPNLFYQVVPKDHVETQLLQVLRDHPGESGIIYRTTRKSVTATVEFLQRNGVRALAYHAGLTPQQRKESQERFNRDEVDVVVATIAFGMGIDKSNVRFVLHADLPKNLEGYYQETGRAGRDGEASHCQLFFSRSDRIKLRYFIDQMEDKKEQQVAEQQLFDMVRYAETKVCRRIYLLGYFGESYTKSNCGACDVCMGDVERVDATVSAQKVMSAIYRSGQTCGAAHIVDILIGAKTDRIRQLGHDQLKTFGVGKDSDSSYWRRVMDDLLSQECIRQNASASSALELTPKGQQILLGKKSFDVLRKKESTRGDLAQFTGEYSIKLFMQLRNERLRLAQMEGLPPFVIFSDSTLREMALYFPDTPERMAGITGVSAAKLEKYCDSFMTIIEMYKFLHPEEAQQRSVLQIPVSVTIKKGKSGGSEQATLKLARQGFSMEEIAAQRGITVDTIAQHIEKLIDAGQGKYLVLDQLMKPARRMMIEELFRRAPQDSLKALQEASDHPVSYAELRIVRALMPKK